METKILVRPKLVEFITFGFAKAITLWPFILLKYEKDLKNERLLRHEKIHIDQQTELFVVGFYILYLFYFIKYYIKTGIFVLAYRSIPFEREAKLYESFSGYINIRKKYNWRQFK